MFEMLTFGANGRLQSRLNTPTAGVMFQGTLICLGCSDIDIQPRGAARRRPIGVEK